MSIKDIYLENMVLKADRGAEGCDRIHVTGTDTRRRL